MEDSNEEILNWLTSKKDKIPHVEKLIKKLRNGKEQEGHFVHALILRNIFESKKFPITDVEDDDGNYDIDIELDNSINIQVHYGASTAWYNSERGNVSSLGGVPRDWDKDKEVILKKINQLPTKDLGILFQVSRGTGMMILPEWIDELPNNKVIVLTHYEQRGVIMGVAEVYCSKEFEKEKKVTKIIQAAGYSVKGFIKNQRVYPNGKGIEV